MAALEVIALVAEAGAGVTVEEDMIAVSILTSSLIELTS